MKRFLSLLLAMTLVLSMLSVSSFAEEYEDVAAEVIEPVEEAADPVEELSEPIKYSEKNADSNIALQGTCGDDLTWNLVEGVLTISGTGAMSWPEADVDYGYAVPWMEFAGQITTVIIEEGVTSIGPAAFHSYKKLTSVTIPEGVTEICAAAFLGVNALEELVIPSTVTFLGDCALAESRLERLTFMGDRPEKGSDVMMGTSLLSIYYPVGNETWEDKESFYRNEWVAWGAINPENGNLLYLSGQIGEANWLLENGALTISGSGYLHGMQSEDSLEKGYWMPYRNSITTAVIEDGVKNVSKYQFYGCENLTSVSLPGTLETIGRDAFENCPALEEITFRGDAPNDYIHPEAFSDMTLTAYYPAGNETWTDDVMQDYGGTVTWVPYGESVKETISGTCGTNLTWNLEDGVLTISGTGAMYDYVECPWIDYADQITSAVIGEGVTSLGNYAFRGCTSLTNVTIGDEVISLGLYAFSECTALANVTFGNKLATIGIGAFKSCTALTGVDLPDSVTNIDDSAFESCTALTSIDIPTNVTRIGQGSFCNCTALTTVTLHEGLTCIDNEAFNGCKALTAISIPQSVTTMGNAVFGGCKALVSVDIPDSVVSSFSGWFSDCSALTTVTVGSGITYVGWGAFFNCAALESITFRGNAPTLDSDAFYTLTTTVYYPADNTTWDGVVGNNYYSGNITWVAYTSEPEGVTWNLENGVLTISGTGAMCDYSAEEQPWYADRDSIVSIVVEDGVTGIGSNAFRNCSNVNTIVIPASVATIGAAAFNGCYDEWNYHNVLDVYYGGTEQQWKTLGQYSPEYDFIHYGCTDPENHWTVTTTDATCEEVAYVTSECDCGYSYVEMTDGPKGHNYVPVVTQPTYTEKGYTTYTCDGCGDSYKANYVAALSLAAPVLSAESEPVSGGGILTWEAVEDASYYMVYRATSKSGSYKLLTTVEGTGLNVSVSAGSSRYYKIKAVYDDGEVTATSKYSNYVRVKGVCAQPQIVDAYAKASNGKPYIDWNKVSGAKKYYVYCVNEDGTMTRLTSTTSTSYTHSKAVVGQAYTYVVRAIASSSSCNSIYSEAITCLTRCASPKLKISLLSSSGKPELDWKDITGAVGYEVWRAEEDAEPILLAEVTQSSFVDESAVVDVEYEYRIIAVASNPDANSAPSDEEDATAKCAKPVLAAELVENKPKVSWDKVDGAVKYYVYRSTSKSSGYKKVATAEEGESYHDTSAKKNKTYYYKIVAVSAESKSSYSSYVKIKSK